jgi:hypothetical protein
MAQPKPWGPGILDGDEGRHLGPEVLQDLPRRVTAPVVDDDDLVGHLLAHELRIDVPYRRGQGLRLVAGGDDDGEQGEAHQSGAEISSQSGCVPAWAEISSRMAMRGVLGFQPHTLEALEESRTIQGMSNGARSGVRGDRLGAEPLVAPLCQLAKRDRRRHAAADIHDPVVGRNLRGRKLREEERQEVLRVEAVAHLVARAAESDVLERPPAKVAVDPVAEDSLVGPSELPGAGEDAAAVDEDRQVEGVAVLEGEGLAGELRRAVERHGGRRREVLRDALGAHPRREAGRLGLEGAVDCPNREGRQGGDAVDPAGAQEDEPARRLLQYSSRLIVPRRLCSTTCRELERPSTPAITLGFAEASITQSAGGRASMSLAARTSPWTSLIPRRFSSRGCPRSRAG